MDTPAQIPRVKGALLSSLVTVALILLPFNAPALGQLAANLRLYERRCATCHQNPSRQKNIPDDSQLLKMSPEVVYSAIAKLPAHTSIQNIPENEKLSIAEYLGGRKVRLANGASATPRENRCTSNPALRSGQFDPEWSGWGADTANSRFQPARAAGLLPDQVPQLKLKWAFGFPDVEAVYGQPSVWAGRVFIGVDTGMVYSLDARTGCVYWSFEADAGVRNAISIAPVKGKDLSQFAAYFGDIKANLYKLDARSGKLLWKIKIEDNPVARITGSPALYRDRLYVPVASIEEWVAGLGVNYPCCTFRGSVAAVDAGTGKQIWKTYVIPDQPKLAGKTPNGAQRWAPAGGGVWDSPTVDAQAHAIYIGTGDSYTEPAPNTIDAVMALDMYTGKLIWSVQDTGGDVWLYACRPGYASGNCPAKLGPDFDFGSSPILKVLPDGRRILIAGQKSGVVWAHDASRMGAVVWKTQLSDTLAPGEITFGGAANDQAAYFGLRDGGVAAIDLATGSKKWFATEDDYHNSTHLRGQTAAVTGIPAVIFSGGWDGMLRAYSTENGQRIWEYDTVREFKTVNGVAAKGGSMAGPGPVVAGGMLFVGSGYVVGASVPGNVLLAFGP